jgi:aminopeptidase N
VARYFEEMPSLATRRSPAIVGQIGTSAFPRYAVSAATVELAEAVLARPDVEPVLRRIVVDATDELSRALASRGISTAASSLGSGSSLGSPARERGQ